MFEEGYRRRRLIGAALALPALALPGRTVRAAEDFPNRAVTLVVSGPAGGTTDYTHG